MSLRLFATPAVVASFVLGTGGCSLLISEADSSDAGGPSPDASSPDATDCVNVTFEDTIDLVDEFDVLDDGLWLTEDVGDATTDVQGGALQISLMNLEDSYAAGGLNSLPSYDLVGQRVFIHMLEFVEPPAASLSLLIETATEAFRLRKIGNELRFERQLLAENSPRIPIAVSGFGRDDQRIWQLREDSGNLIAEVGPTIESLVEIGSDTATDLGSIRVRLLAEATTPLTASAQIGGINTICSQP